MDVWVGGWLGITLGLLWNDLVHEVEAVRYFRSVEIYIPAEVRINGGTPNLPAALCQWETPTHTLANAMYAKWIRVISEAWSCTHGQRDLNLEYHGRC